MNLIRRNSDLAPFGSFLDHFFGDETTQKLSQSFNRLPSVNIEEDDNAFYVAVEAPGFKKDQFKVEIDNDLLTISAEVKEEKESKERNYYRREFSSGNFSRSFQLPENKVKEDKIKASYQDGILHIELPKREEAKPAPSRMISVN